MKIIQGSFIPFELDPLWCSWFVGFIDGEGYFQIHSDKKSTHCYVALTIEQREDDENILREIQKRLKCGDIYFVNMQKDRDRGRLSSNKYRWTLRKIESIVRIIIPLLDTYPLRSKKLNEYLLWREIAWMIWRGNPHLGFYQKSYIEEIRDKLKFMRMGPFERSINEPR